MERGKRQGREEERKQATVFDVKFIPGELSNLEFYLSMAPELNR